MDVNAEYFVGRGKELLLIGHCPFDILQRSGKHAFSSAEKNNKKTTISKCKNIFPIKLLSLSRNTNYNHPQRILKDIDSANKHL